MLDSTAPSLGQHIRNKIGQGLRSYYEMEVRMAPPMPARMTRALSTLAAMDEGQGTPGNGVTDDLARRG